MKPIYTAYAIATGGRSGHAETDDKNLVVELTSPGAWDKKSGKATNPEQLFACGYAACFGSAIEFVARQQGLTVSNAEVHSEVTLNDGSTGFSISVALNVTLPGVESAITEQLVKAAHAVCPYSKATKGNIDVVLKVNDRALAKAA
jgi:osmotically inducible protein OsmC